jgi:hypothetical protein
MGLYAFRRLRELEAASAEAASLSVKKPTPAKPTTKADGSNNRRNSGRGKRKQLPDAE